MPLILLRRLQLYAMLHIRALWSLDGRGLAYYEGTAWSDREYTAQVDPEIVGF